MNIDRNLLFVSIKSFLDHRDLFLRTDPELQAVEAFYRSSCPDLSEYDSIEAIVTRMNMEVPPHIDNCVRFLRTGSEERPRQPVTAEEYRMLLA